MQLTIHRMTKEFATEILQWQYEPPYDLYNYEGSSEELEEMLDNSYEVVLSNEKVIGFFCLGLPAQVPAGNSSGAYSEEALDIGLGMKPDLTGRGKGTDFFTFILEFLSKRVEGVPLRLTVATFNRRAIRLYEKTGFEQRMKFERNGMPFITMVRTCK